jgi:GNAT superfamily N-acetyltransferase
MSSSRPTPIAQECKVSAAFQLRPATAVDGPAVIGLITALADFEKLPPPDEAGRARLLEHGFGPKPRFETWLATVPDSAAPVGYVLVFETYSTFEARPSLYIEDLFVLPAYRKLGIGTALLELCRRLARERGCGRMEWTCLDWNKRAQCVYESLGATPMKEWILYRLTRDKLAAPQ